MQFSVLRMYLKVSYPVPTVPLCWGQVKSREESYQKKQRSQQVLSLHTCCTWLAQNFYFFKLEPRRKSQCRIDQKSKLVASRKNMVTSGSTVLINIHAQPQSWAAATPWGGVWTLPMTTLPLSLYCTPSSSLIRVLLTWPLLAFELETPERHQGVSHMAGAE